MTKLLAIVGSYEKSIYGVEYSLSDDGVKSQTIAFALPVHTGCIKSIAVCSKYMASGSTDETIRLFDLSKRKDIGTLTTHSGTVSCLEFVNDDMLVSAAEDGFICFYRCRDWEETRRIKAHKYGITAMAKHPSGKLLLSAGKDCKLRMWDLCQGKLACAKKATISGIVAIRFSPDGSMYSCLSTTRLQVFKGDDCILDVKPSIKSLHCHEFLTNILILVGGEGGDIQGFDVSSQERVTLSTGLKPRIKTINRINDTTAAVCSSDGTMAIVTIDASKSQLSTLITSKSGLRITCSCVLIRQ